MIWLPLCREEAKVATALLQMDLQASEVRLRWKDGLEGDKLRYRQSQDLVQQAAYAGAGDPPPLPGLGPVP